MGIQIEGSSAGRTVDVDKEHRLCVAAVSENLAQRINKSTNKVWCIPFEGLNPTNANSVVLYIKNTGDKAVHINEFCVSADTAITQVKLEGATGIAIGGNTLAPVSLTVGASAIPVATIETGTDITGLTGIGILGFIQCSVVNTNFFLDVSSRIRIPKGQAVMVSVEAPTANITGTIVLLEEE